MSFLDSSSLEEGMTLIGSMPNVFNGLIMRSMKRKMHNIHPELIDIQTVKERLSMNILYVITSLQIPNIVCVSSVDEYCRLCASTTLPCFKRFCNAIFNIYSTTYLREPNRIDMRKLLE